MGRVVFDLGGGRRGLRRAAWAAGLLTGLAMMCSGSAAALPSNCSASATTVTCSFFYTGAAQSFTVPGGVNSVAVDVFGAQGGAANIRQGGLGGEATATLSVSPGEVLELLVGGQGGPYTNGTPNQGIGGFNGGGAGGAGPGVSGGGPGAGGGGASDVRTGVCAETLNCGLSARVLVGGGGGGSAVAGGSYSGQGGGGGNPAGTAGANEPGGGGGGGGGTQTHGGSGGAAENPSPCPVATAPAAGAAGDTDVGGAGGDAGSQPPSLGGNGGAGGGGGYFGGGGGGGDCASSPGAGGGGSSFGPADATFNNATRSGDGLVTISYTASAPTITSANNTAFKAGQTGSFTIDATGIPTPSLSESGGLPSGVSFTDNGNGTGTLAGTPAAGTGGDYPIAITASNGVSPAATQSFTLTVQAPPSVSIAVPAADSSYALGQVVGSSFSCSEGAGGLGIASCVGPGGRGSGAPIDTSSTGQHAFTVTATSKDGLTATATVIYAVDAARLSHLRVMPHAFHAATKGQAVTSRMKSGATITYRDTLAAHTNFHVYRELPGVMRGGKCVAPPKRDHRGTDKPCTRLVRVGSFKHHDHAGTNRLRFTGRVGGHALSPGRYKLEVSAALAGHHSRTVSASFTILPR